MPVMDGIQATQEIRKLEITAKIRNRITIIALTAYSTEMFTDKCFMAGMDAFMIKPVCNE